jgi:hypothetical protein
MNRPDATAIHARLVAEAAEESARSAAVAKRIKNEVERIPPARRKSILSLLKHAND